MARTPGSAGITAIRALQKACDKAIFLNNPRRDYQDLVFFIHLVAPSASFLSVQASHYFKIFIEEDLKARWPCDRFPWSFPNGRERIFRNQ